MPNHLPKFITHDMVDGVMLPLLKKRGRKIGGKSPWLTPDKTAKIIHMRKDGESYKVIALAVGASETTARAHIRKNAPHLIRRQKSPSDKVKRSDYSTIAAMRREGKTYEEIAKVYGITRERIRQILGMFAPDLTGYHASLHKHWVCAVCGKESHPGKDDRTTRLHYNNLSHHKDSLPIMCPEHARVFTAYRRVRSRIIIYEERYRFIMTEKAKGTPLMHLGFKWKKIPYASPIYGYYKNKKPPGALFLGDHVWASRIIKLYEDAISRIGIMEHHYSWLKNMYEAWVKDIAPERLTPYAESNKMGKWKGKAS